MAEVQLLERFLLPPSIEQRPQSHTSNGEMLSFRQTSEKVLVDQINDGRIATPLGRRQRVAPLTKAIPSLHATWLRIVGSLIAS